MNDNEIKETEKQILNLFFDIYNFKEEEKNKILRKDFDRQLKNIENGLIEIIESKDEKYSHEIVNHITYMIAIASRYLSNDVFKKNTFLKNINKEDLQNWINNNYEEKAFSKLEEVKKDFFGKVKSDYVYDIFFKKMLIIERFNQEFLISNFSVISNLIILNNKDLNIFYTYIFKNIFWLRCWIENFFKNKNEDNKNKNLNISIALISLLIINDRMATISFNKLNGLSKDYFLKEKNIEDFNLILLNTIKNKFIKKSKNYKSERNINIIESYNKDWLINQIKILENGLNSYEFTDLNEKNINNILTKESKRNYDQLLNNYELLFYNWAKFTFFFDNYFNKIINIFDDKYKEKWEAILGEDKFNKFELFLKKINDGIRHNGLYIKDNNRKNFITIFNEINNFLKNIKEELKKIKPENWFIIDKDFPFNKNNLKNDKSNYELKVMHKGIVISNINRLIKNIYNNLDSQNNKKRILMEENKKSKNFKVIRLFNDKDFRKKPKELREKFDKILEKNIEKETEIKRFIELFYEEKYRKGNITNIVKKESKLKLEKDEDIKLQFIDSKKITNDFLNEEEIFKFLNEDKSLDKRNLFMYYENLLNKKNLNENLIKKEDIKYLIEKNAIIRNLKYILFDLNTIEKAKIINANDYENKIELINNFFDKFIIKNLEESNDFIEFEKKIKDQYIKRNLKIISSNPNLKIGDEYFKKKIYNKKINRKDLIKEIKNKYFSLLKNKNNFNKNIIFYTYIKKNIIDFTSLTYFKESIIKIINGNEKNIEKIKNLFPSIKLVLKNKKGINFLSIDSGSLNRFKINQLLSDYQKNVDKNNEKIKDFIGEWKLISYKLKWKIKSKVFNLNEYLPHQNLILRNERNSKLVLKNKDMLKKLVKVFDDNINLKEKYNLLYNELKNKLKIAHLDFKKIKFDKIEQKAIITKIKFEYNPNFVSFVKLKNKDLENYLMPFFKNNKEINFEGNKYFLIKPLKILNEIIVNL